MKSFPGGVSTEVLHLAINAEWMVVSSCREADALFTDGALLVGLNLRHAMIAHCPEWDGVLPVAASNLLDRKLFLPWHFQETQAMGWQCKAMRVGQLISIILVPVAAPAGSFALSETGAFGDNDSLQKVVRLLFQRVQQQELRFDYFFRNLPGAHFVQTRDLEFFSFNESLEKLLGPPLIERLRGGEHWLNWVHRDDVKELHRCLKVCSEGSVPVGFRFRLVPPEDSRVLYLMDLRLPVRGLGRQLNGFEGLWLDLTRGVLAENLLQQAAWRERLAEISGSISHDFNNVLTGICSLTELVHSDMATDERHSGNLRIIRDSARQAQHLIQRIVSLNREQQGEVRLHNLCDIIMDQKELIRIILPKDTVFKIDIPKMEIPVMTDAVALRRILLNFATNARDALGSGGEVELAVRVVDFAQYSRHGLVSNHCPDQGQGVEICFRDNGRGISQEVQSKIFCPYFSTKRKQDGSGLGLYTVVRFAEDNQFDYGVRSIEGMGTEMVLLLRMESIDLDMDDDFEYADFVATGIEDVEPEDRATVDVVCINSNSGCMESLVDALQRKGLNAERVEKQRLLLRDFWNGAESCPSAVVAFVSPDEPLDEEVLFFIGRLPAGMNRYLLVNGINPDRYSHLLGEVFSAILFSHAGVDFNVETIVEACAKIQQQSVVEVQT